MFVLTILAGIGIPWYLIESFLLANELKKDFEPEWIGLGRPSAIDASTQGALLKIIVGVVSLPENVGVSIHSRLKRVRIAGAIGGVSVAAIFAVVLLGK